MDGLGVSLVSGQTFMCLDPFLNLFLTLSKTSLT